jgi:minor extracellular serine protease Vpr
MQSLHLSQDRNLGRMGVALTLCVAFLMILVQPQAAWATPFGNVTETSVEVSGPPVVAAGEEFEVSVVVRSVSGLFGGQFELSFDPADRQGVNDSLLPGVDLEPYVVGVKSIDNDTGSILFAASRAGDVEGLSGDVVLATVRFVALAPVEWTTIGISNILLGDKNANQIASGTSQDLTLAITPAGATVRGQVMLGGRTTGNWEGALVTIGGTELEATTNAEGNFEFPAVPPGIYTFQANADGYLAAECDGVEVIAPLTELMPVELVAGDVTGDGFIDISDAVAIGVAFGDVTSNPAADLNGDGAVNVFDLILMAVNFGAASPTTWACIDP